MITRADIREHVSGEVERLTDDLTDLIWSRMRQQLTEVLDAARSALASDLDLSTTVEASSPSEMPTITRTPAASPKPALSPRASGRKPHTCKLCGAIGFTSATCGKTHNVQTTSQAEAVAPKAPPPSSFCRSVRRDRRSRPPSGSSTSRRPDGRLRAIAARN